MARAVPVGSKRSGCGIQSEPDSAFLSIASGERKLLTSLSLPCPNKHGNSGEKHKDGECRPLIYSKPKVPGHTRQGTFRSLEAAE